ncbi:PEP-CTERM/exosortase system-associated acyltransferase [Halorhodospira halophila]|uniref:PEP-CTERM/exosortase system-associated acyltransferase n=1 Tax=Halorhodospira halophila (strain DSM 244 / SL1) TaxID=349124 RepID=A1WX79_HALHL|nr:PEP-CTERM/exosortase system-associated acyltransferase [Halorhodospira halophila]ABM62291.1 conserved hypothetical protein [Halorhodospira halophila SL1]MBK1729266.1 PEP-CTERM/exosortase system-associated acyltransferase [Halorhodospira halophila]
MDRNELVNQFQAYFEYQVALTPEQRREAFQLRYDVYCMEYGYEDPSDHPDGQEQDDFDESALICTVRHTQTGRLAGCFRIILPGMEPSEPERLQMEVDCTETLYTNGRLDSGRHPKNLRRDSVCEVSRLAIHTDFRKRPGEKQTRMGAVDWLDLPEDQRLAHLRTFPLLGSSLFSAVAYTCGRLGRDHIFAVMEPRLARLLTREGIRFQQIGDVMEYHGEERAAYYNSLEKFVVETVASPLLRPLYRMGENQLAPGLTVWLERLRSHSNEHSCGRRPDNKVS